MSQRRRVAIVTGAGSPTGIGFASARVLRDAGFALVVAATTDRIEQRASELRAGDASVRGVVADLTIEAGADRVVAVAAALGEIAVLVNNAGMTSLSAGVDVNRAIGAVTLDDWNAGIARNITSAFLMSRAVLPYLQAAGWGRIINIASTTGAIVAMPNQSIYSAAKAAMVGFTRSLALETARSGISVNAIAPGWIATGSMTESERAAATRTPLGRPGTPDEVGSLVAYLSTLDASYITGQTFVIDGGNSIVEDASLFSS